MESATRASGMPFPEDLRPKQREVIEAFQTRDALIAQLPTGYGKTRAAAGAFAQLRHRGACNRMLCIVPRRGQAMQAVKGLPDDLAEFGIKTEALIVGDTNHIRALKEHNSNNTQVFVATIQSLLGAPTWLSVCQLMQTGKWFVWFDEHHHYGSYEDGDGEWTNKVKSLCYSAMLAMSATAKRPGDSNHFADPEIKETYKDAADAGYVKKLDLHAYEYSIDAVTVDGEVRQYTTESLAEEAGGDSPDKIDAHILSKKMRFSPKYISPLVMFPCDRLLDLRLQGVKAQMLVQVMSCAHAKCVVDQVRAVLPADISVDWVGTGPNGRPQDENDDVLNRFCPPKDSIGRRPWTLDVLVNVGMAGEGLDSMDVAEVVFLTSANLTISNKQVIGRGARLMRLAHHQTQPDCHINVDSGSPMADFVGRKVERIFDEDMPEPIGDDEPLKPREVSDYEEMPDKFTIAIYDMRLINIRGMAAFKEVYNQQRSKPEYSQWSDERLIAQVEEAVVNYFNRRTNDASSIYAQKSEQLSAMVNKLVGLVIRRATESGLRPDRTVIGDLCKRINSRKKRDLGGVPEADCAELETHRQWLKNLEKLILSQPGFGGVPPWLR